MNQQSKIILADMATGHWKILADKWQSQGLNGINGDSPKLRKSKELGTLVIYANFLQRKFDEKSCFCYFIHQPEFC